MQLENFRAALIPVAALFLITAGCNGSDGNGHPDADGVVDPPPEMDGDDTVETVEEEESAEPQPFGSPCTGDEGCIEGVCFESTCTRACGSYAQCPEAGTRCSDDGTGRALCLTTSFPTDPGTTGTSCALHGQSDCADGYICIQKTPDDPYAFCTAECANDRSCPAGYLCKALVEGERSYCRPRGYCERCLFDDECGFAGDRCIADDLGNKFCSQQCRLEGDTCPMDSTCTDIGGGVLQCLPDYTGHRCVGDGELCSPCEVDQDCTGGGQCIEDYYTHFTFCSVPCSDPSCPAPLSFYCNEDNQCRPRKGSCSEPSGGQGLCKNCEDFTDCVSGYCLPFPDQYHLVCGEDCSDDMTCDSVWAECYEITDGYSTIGYNCLPKDTLANCFQYESCVDNCPDGPAGCALPFCQL
jgi:hypothetical protein